MNRGFLVLAQNNDNDDYVLQACLLALSLNVHNPKEKISIVTNDTVPETFISLFDQIIPIPFQDNAETATWKVENRWKLYHASPYDETIVMDTDMLILQNLDTWWKFLSNYELFFTSAVLDYRNTPANTDYYRQTFIKNNLPNLFSGFHYFKKCNFAKEFYTWLELVVNNWETFYEQHLDGASRPSHVSIDVCASIVTKILDCETQITNSVSKIPTFIHMKSKCQGWTNAADSWQDQVGFYMSKDCGIKIGNYVQSGILHYTENDFIERSPAFERYRSLLSV